MKQYTLIQEIVFLIIIVLIIIPGWIDYFDNGKDKITLEKLLLNDSKLISNNIDVSGIGLFSKSCRYENIDDNKIKSVLWYVPFVTKKWTSNDTIKSILVFDSGKRSWDKSFDLAVRKLDKKIDSLSKLNKEITVLATYKNYEIFKWEDEAIKCVFRNNKLLFESKWSLKKLEVNGKHSMGGKLFLSVLAFITFIYISRQIIKNNFG